MLTGPEPGVKVAVRVRPVPEIGPSVPPVTTTSPTEPSQRNVTPGSSLKVNVISAVSSIPSSPLSLVIATVGEVRSTTITTGVEATLVLPARSVALAVIECVPSVNVDV